MATLVTGGTGYIGSHTVVELLGAGKDVVILDNFYNSSPKVLPRIAELAGRAPAFEECDIRDRAGLDRIFETYKIDSVIHFAGLKAVGESCEKPLLYYENNIGGTVTLCEAMAAHGCKTIVFSSSATVYGSKNVSPLREDMPVGGTTNPYGTTKYYIEHILEDTAAADKDWHVCLLRYFNPIGAHKSGRIGEMPNGIPNNLLPYITQVAAGKLDHLNIYGNDYNTPDGTGVRDYLHVCDLADGHACAVTYARAHKGVEAINLGTGTGYSVLDMVKAFEKVNNIKINYVIGPRRPGDLDASYSDPSKAERLLGWKAKRTLEDMCRDGWNWQSHNPKGYK